MTYEQFWDGDVDIAKAYRKAHEIKRREYDQQAWVQGAYIYHAIGALAPALKAFAKGQVKPYLEHPFTYEEQPKATVKSKEERSDEKALTWMEMWAISFNENFDKKGGDSVGRDGVY